MFIYGPGLHITSSFALKIDFSFFYTDAIFDGKSILKQLNFLPPIHIYVTSV